MLKRLVSTATRELLHFVSTSNDAGKNIEMEVSMNLPIGSGGDGEDDDFDFDFLIFHQEEVYHGSRAYLAGPCYIVYTVFRHTSDGDKFGSVGRMLSCYETG